MTTPVGLTMYRARSSGAVSNFEKKWRKRKECGQSVGWCINDYDGKRERLEVLLAFDVLVDTCEYVETGVESSLK